MMPKYPKLCFSSTPSFTNCICGMITYTIPRALVGKAFRNTASPNFSGGQCRFNSSCCVEAKALWEPMGRIDFGTWMGKTQIFFGKAMLQDSRIPIQDSTQLSLKMRGNLLSTTILTLTASSSDRHCSLVTPDILRGVLKCEMNTFKCPAVLDSLPC